MSTSSRLIWGTIASWARICVTILFQIVLVPVFLGHWSTQTYGIWLAIQSLIYVLTILDLGHQTFLGYEFLRFGATGKEKISHALYSGIILGAVISVVQILLIFFLVRTPLMISLLGETKSVDQHIIQDAGEVLLLQGITWLLCTSASGLLSRALITFGHFTRISLWQIYIAIITGIAPAIAVMFGADLLKAGIFTAIATVVFSIPQYVDMFLLLRKEKIDFVSPSLKLGWKNFYSSLALSGRIILENTRQQGVRLIVAPLSGINALAAFSTMRTMSNFALQGLNTITNPLMPELSRFLHQRDQERMESAFGTLWVVLIIILAPSVLVLQAVVEPLYHVWTRGKLPFDPFLFAFLSLSVLVYALEQSAMAIIVGNNLLKAQLFVSAVVAIIVIAGIYFLLPSIGIVAAGIALLGAEIFATVGYRLYAEQWLKKNGLKWPKKAYLISATSVVCSGIAMILMILLPAFKWFTLIAAILMLFWIFSKYWKALPEIATQNVKRLVVRLPGVNKIIR